MEPVLLILAPGIAGGVLMALLFARLAARPDPGITAKRLEPPSPGMINMARIRIDGLGGFGMLAMAVVVAVFVPRIRATVALALVLGAGLAAALIAFRRSRGPLPSSSEHAGAHSTLFSDDGSAAPASRLRP